MTKTLTEQWKDGKLSKGLYYVRSTSGRECVAIHSGSQSFMFSSNDKYACQAKEVLEPVPSYEEYNDLIQQNVNQESAIETYIERIHELEERIHELEERIHELEEQIHELEEQIPNGTWFTQKSHNELLNKIEQLEKKLEERGKNEK